MVSSLGLYSQELVVKSFYLNGGDLSARTEPRRDANGNQCALIKVEAIPVCEFGGYVIGNVEKKLGSYWVYVCAKNPISRKIIVASDNFQPIEVEFANFGIDNIEPGATYTMRIESFNPSAIDVIDGHKYIDLGLSVNWAECNLGALTPDQIGIRDEWAVNLVDTATIDNSVISIRDTKYDFVSQLWGCNWRIPTKSELSEMLDLCIMYDDVEKGIEGKRVIGLTGNSIFFPYTDEHKNIRKSVETEKMTSIWSCSRGKKFVLGAGILIRAYFLELSPSNNEVSMIGYESTKRFFRPVVNKSSHTSSETYWGTPTNGRYLIKGQVEYLNIGRNPVSTRVNVYDNLTGKLLQQIFNEKGLFEMWVEKDQELRFEFDDDSQQKPTIVIARPIMKVRMNYTAKVEFGLS